MAPAASARGRVFIGGYGFYGGGWGPGWWGPGWYGPYWGPAYGYGYGYYPGRNTGNMKIVTQAKGMPIYVDGGYAGVTGKLKKFPLRAGNHAIELRDRNGRAFYSERVEVIPGKTVEIHPDYRG